MSQHLFRHGNDTAVVVTAKGRVRGYEYDGVSIFKGIPYANAKRFHAPEPTDTWEGVYDATNYGYVCPLMSTPMIFGELQNPHRYWVQNENCQNLNLWTPSCDSQKRPVFMWLHGGGFTEGSSVEQLAFEGENLSRYGEVVVVSINHRVNLLGYCDLSDFGDEYKNSANAGTADTIAALHWIHENIENFGGDPQNVTIFGQSGGGEKVSVLLQTPAADGLYQKCVIMSGVLDPNLEDTKGSGKELVEAMLNELKTDDIKVLEKITYQELIEVYNKVSPRLKKEGKYIGLVPNPNEFYVGMPIEHGFRKETADVPMMIGTVFGEMVTVIDPEASQRYRQERMLSKEQQIECIEKLIGEKGINEMFDEFEKAYPERPIADIHFIDMVFRLPTKKYIDMRSVLNSCTYSYMFNQDLPLNGNTAPWHCAEIPFMFHNTELVPVTQIPEVTQKLETQMVESLIAFAKTGTPSNVSIPEWPASTSEEEKTMIFDANTRLICNNDKKLLQLLKKYFGPVYGRELQNSMEFLFGDKWMKMWQ
ncbi:carboxylesterase/lipase family protein [Anaerocolumna xylanovorans]|uniref:Carboxylic ester hydrolase n=1 Tax=Anaerocolumna xylanovorans DSM 12503 TaxID=1121345 RepID=A0A1M7Y0Y3_9FIRM|nr:carboxylesterase family protein [Anaerocolumna xylanovorans]SHO45354.1 para-nitrobenzyl esterase [Anaerocolumna xylanovorans DSM 12503]